MSDEKAKEEDIGSQNENTDRIRTGTPRKSKAKELLLMEEFCVFCYGSPSSNDEDFEELLRCSECLKYAHPSCLEMPVTAIENTKLYDWQCNDCKGCFQCKKKTKEKCIILCDYCDRGFHTFCLEKRPTQAKKTSWKCPFCDDANIGSNKHSASNNSTCLLSVKGSPPESVFGKADEKVVSEQPIIFSAPEPILGKFIIDSEQSKLSLEKEDSPKKKEGVVRAGTKQEKIEHDDGFTEILQLTVEDNEKSKGEKSMQAGNNEKQIKRAGPVGDASIQKATDAVTSDVGKGMKLESVEEKYSKKTETRDRLLRRFSQRLCTSTVHVSLDDIIEKDDKIHIRTKDEVFHGKMVRNDSLKMPKNTLHRRRSSRFSIPGLGNSVVHITDIKKENRLDNEANPGTDGSEKKVNSQDTFLSRDKVKVTGKRRHSMIEKAIGQEDVNEDVPLISFRKAFSGLKAGKEKLKQKTDEENGKAKLDEGGDKSDVECAVPIKRKRGRPRKYPLKQENLPKEEKEIIHSDSDRNSQDKAVKLDKFVNHSRTRELRVPSANDSKDEVKLNINKEEEENRRILRKTSREPTISPTKVRSILTGKKLDKVHPVSKEFGKSPRVKRELGSVQSKSPSVKVEKSPTKSTVKKMRKSTERITPKASPSSSAKRSNTIRSEREKSSSKLSARKKEEKSRNKVNNESAPKRKLSFEEKPKDIKKAKISREEKQDSEVNQRPKRRSMASKKEDQRKEVQDNDLGDFVSLEDTALFEEAQKMLKEDNKTRDTSKIIEQGIRTVHFGEYEIDTWYSSPYPSEFKLLGEVFVCEYCLKYMKSATILRRHMAKCAWRHPPGDEIYRKDKISVFEVDGEKSSTYCQNLCLFAKLFLDHKTLYYEVEPFLFYVMTLVDCSGCHMVGYFSKEKVSFLNYNVSCILVLPHCMRKGYGKALIDFSYLLSRVEGKVGSPERPLSDLGLISYRSYWKDILLRYLTTLEDDRVSIKELSQKTSIMSNDLISTMQYLGILKYWKGKHVITVQQEMLDVYAAKSKSNRKVKLTLEESSLSWTPTDYGNNKNRSKIS